MRYFSVATACATTAIALFLPSVTDAALCPSLSAHKKIAQALLDEVFNKLDATAVDRYISPTTYRQHNPLAADGPQTLKGLIGFLTNETKVEFGTIVAEDDLVWANTRYQMPGASASVGVDVFRFENDKIVEHWDIIQTEVQVNKTASGRSMFPVKSSAAPAPAPITCGDGCELSDTRLNGHKKIARALLDDVFNKKDVSAVDKYISSTTYLQHNPLVPDGPQSLKAFAATFTKEAKVEFGAIAAVDDLVWVNTRYTGVPGLNTSVALDVFRFANDKIVEHWDYIQTEVPASKTASGRPMFPIQA